MSLPQITLGGRPVKFVSLALLGAMLTIGIFSIVDLGILDGSEWGDILGCAAFAVSVLFVASWWARSQALTEWALLGAFGVWVWRLLAIVLVNPHPLATDGLYMSAWWALLAAGAWWRESRDPSPDLAR